jgi:hypothetical protein
MDELQAADTSSLWRLILSPIFSLTSDYSGCIVILGYHCSRVSLAPACCQRFCFLGPLQGYKPIVNRASKPNRHFCCSTERRKSFTSYISANAGSKPLVQQLTPLDAIYRKTGEGQEWHSQSWLCSLRLNRSQITCLPSRVLRPKPKDLNPTHEPACPLRTRRDSRKSNYFMGLLHCLRTPPGGGQRVIGRARSPSRRRKSVPAGHPRISRCPADQTRNISGYIARTTNGRFSELTAPA